MGPKTQETCGFNTELSRDPQRDPSPNPSASTCLGGMVVCHLLGLGRHCSMMACTACVALHGYLADEMPPLELLGSGPLNILSPEGGAGRTRL